MSDSGFREIQLSGKHVVFLFMAGVVAAVAIFLLGVSVGRGVTRPDEAAPVVPSPVATVAGDSQPTEALPKTTPEQGELKYSETLMGKDEAKGTTPSPAASPAAPPAAPAKPDAAATPSPKPSASPKAPAKAAPPAAGTVWVQANSFSSRGNAERQVAELKAKGIVAKVVDAPGSGARYKVRVGPLDKAAADAMLARLRKEGYKPSLIR